MLGATLRYDVHSGHHNQKALQRVDTVRTCLAGQDVRCIPLAWGQVARQIQACAAQLVEMMKNLKKSLLLDIAKPTSKGP